MKNKTVAPESFCLSSWKTREVIDTSVNFGKIKVSIPARFDFIGGWTDTPPYYFDNDAAVLNTTMLLGAASIVITIKPSKMFGVTENGDPLIDVSNHMVLSKTLALCGLDRPNVKIAIYNSIPRGSGLGGSSLLSAAILSAILGFYRGAEKIPGSMKDIVGDILMIEQLMESGGGWQDQIGGLLPGIKLIETRPSNPEEYNISYIKNVGQLRDNCLIIDTRIQRRAAIILYSIRQKYIDGDLKTRSVLRTIKDNAKIGFEELNKGNVAGFSKLLSESWQMVNSVELNSSIDSIGVMKSLCGKDLLGIKIGGAGGGGFILTVFKDKDRRDYYENIICDHFPDCLVYEPIFGSEGMVVEQKNKFLEIGKADKI